MRIAIQATISGVKGQEPRTEDIGVLEYSIDAAPASGLGLFIGEAHQLLRQLQTVVLREQVAQFMEHASRCRQRGSRLGIKDTKPIKTLRVTRDRHVTLYPIQYRSEVEMSGSSGIAGAGCSRNRRANRADVAHPMPGSASQRRQPCVVSSTNSTP
jgi:hypothetical protein